MGFRLRSQHLAIASLQQPALLSAAIYHSRGRLLAGKNRTTAPDPRANVGVVQRASVSTHRRSNRGSCRHPVALVQPQSLDHRFADPEDSLLRPATRPKSAFGILIRGLTKSGPPTWNRSRSISPGCDTRAFPRKWRAWPCRFRSWSWWTPRRTSAPPEPRKHCPFHW